MLFSYFLLFLIVPVEIENARLNLALAISTGAPITVTNDAIEMLPVVTDKTINGLSSCQNKQYIYQVFCSLVLFL